MKTGEKIAVGVGVGGAITGTLLWVLRAKAAPGLAQCYGVAVDYTTGQPINSITVSLDTMMRATESDGKFSFQNVEPGIYTLLLGDSLGRYEEVSMSVTLSAGQSKDVGNIQMTPIGGPPPPPPPPPTLGKMEGRVFDKGTGSAIVGKNVYIDGYTSTNPTDSNGYFAVENLAAGTYYSLTADGYEPYSL